MIVIITVHDLNDNIPQFIDSPYQVNVSEVRENQRRWIGDS